ncbi:hypothetical protein CBM2592_A190031 [Cupriavidus taiwanensis]|nr:hypothetical protein CBM2592_A190031 [Cupriavidus taiwanensis]SOY83055.1 hypothetical protein CBM2591_A230033 [Cupriavidus taiwanensis]SOZ56249.1 hypothetical protein CBM2617_A200038 [Cupriavidus taiwanensis]SOZ78825.1 hypothetical protein CBM2618_A180040 [Cupriavidus taiwanensis]SOZ79101.1 hypothetical protein CBM2622_A170038 [Cupriavidus taiwanensis]
MRPTVPLRAPDGPLACAGRSPGVRPKVRPKVRPTVPLTSPESQYWHGFPVSVSKYLSI